jgi:predicted  nucleic acid-binding Zn-ribbon protein
MADLQLDAYRDAAKLAADAALSPEAKAKEIAAAKDKIAGLTTQMKELGRRILDAEAEISAAKTRADSGAENLAQGQLASALEVLRQNFELRKETVAKLRTLGATVADPYVP